MFHETLYILYSYKSLNALQQNSTKINLTFAIGVQKISSSLLNPKKNENPWCLVADRLPRNNFTLSLPRKELTRVETVNPETLELFYVSILLTMSMWFQMLPEAAHVSFYHHLCRIQQYLIIRSQKQMPFLFCLLTIGFQSLLSSD